MAVANTLLFCFVFLATIQQVCLWNSDKPIYKWSPVMLGYDQYMDKRYNDEKPILKWNPRWLNRNSVPIYAGKRNSIDSVCRKETERCVEINFNDSNEMSTILHSCCGDLKCKSINEEFLCVNPSKLQIQDNWK